MFINKLTTSEKRAIFALHADLLEAEMNAVVLEHFRDLLDVHQYQMYSGLLSSGSEAQRAFIRQAVMQALRDSALSDQVVRIVLAHLPAASSTRLALDRLHNIVDWSQYSLLLDVYSRLAGESSQMDVKQCRAFLPPQPTYALLKTGSLHAFLRDLPFAHEDWFWHLGEAINKMGEPWAQHWETVVPLFDAQLGSSIRLRLRLRPADQAVNDQTHKRTLVVRQTKAGVYLHDEDAKLDSMFEDGDEHKAEHQPPQQIVPASSSGQGSAIRLYDYQTELCAAPLTGANCIVCAPTGSGKTVVAAHIIKRHLISRRAQDAQPIRVVFLVPSNALITQQRQLLQDYLPKEFSVQAIQASVNTPVGSTLRATHCTVLTYGIFENMIVSNDADALALTDFSLLVLDECHHANKQHPANRVMQRYCDASCLPSGQQRSLPQVICLSASLGVGQSDTLDKAVGHVISMCANMAARRLCTVRAHKHQMLNMVAKSAESTHYVSPGYLSEPFHRSLSQLIGDLEEELVPLLKVCDSIEAENSVCESVLLNHYVKPDSNAHNARARDGDMRFDDQPKRPLEDPTYVTWYSNLRQTVPRAVDRLMSPDERHRANEALAQIRLLHRAVEINGHVSTAAAAQALDAELTKGGFRQRHPQLNARLSQLHDYAQSAANKLVAELVRILLDCAKTDAACRCIVFVRTRVIACRLAEYLNELPEMQQLPAAYLTSVGPSKTDGGMPHDEFKRTIEKLKSGEIKVLVSTTVAEEGLDISECNLVVKYNHVTNEIAMVQRRGRGRAEGSRSILLAQDKWICDKEEINRTRENLQNNALDFVNEKGEQWLQEKVNEKIRQDFDERQLKLKAAQLPQADDSGKMYNVLCRSCSVLICKTRDVKCVENAHHLCTDADVFERCKLHGQNSAAESNEMRMRRLVHGFQALAKCGNPKCGQPWGQVMKWNECTWVVLGAKYIMLDELKPHADWSLALSAQKPKITAKKWKQLCVSAGFRPGEPTALEVRRMQQYHQQRGQNWLAGLERMGATGVTARNAPDDPAGSAPGGV